MPFSEKIKIKVKHKADFRCCRCQEIGIDVHHIIPESERGTNKIDNAAPLCQNCHDRFGDNPKKRKEIRQIRDRWYKIVKDKYQRDEKRWLEINKKLLEMASILEQHEAKIQLIEARIVGKIKAKVDSLEINYSKVYSPSKLSIFEQCPQFYFFSFLDPIKGKMKAKLRQMPENIYPFHTLGKAVHNAITLYYYLPLSQRNEKNLLKKLEETWTSEARWNKKPPLVQWGGFESIEEERGVYVEAIKMLRNFYKMTDKKPTIHYLPTEDFRRSIKDYQGLIVPLTNDCAISGRFDLITQNDDGSLNIIDFKTAKKEVIDQFQLDFYQLLAELNFERPVKNTSFFFLNSGKKRVFNTKRKTGEIQRKVLAKIRRIEETKNFQPKPSRLCQYCEFINFCPKKKEAIKIIERIKREN